MRYAQSDAGSSSALNARRTTAREPIDLDADGPDDEVPQNEDPWASDTTPSSPGTTLSKTSSAYMNVRQYNGLDYPDFDATKDYDPYGPRRTQAAAAIIRQKSEPQPPTEEALAANDRLAPPHRSFGNSQGYRGYIDKTKEVPCLMDAMDSDSASSRATSLHSSAVDRIVEKAESDVFDGLSVTKEESFDENKLRTPRPLTRKQSRPRVKYPARIAEEEDEEADHTKSGDFKVVLLGGGLTAIQSTTDGYSKRATASDYDQSLTNSDVDQNGFARLPGFHEMLAAGKDRDNSLLGIQGNLGASPRNLASDSGSSLFSDPYEDSSTGHAEGDLMEYYVPPSDMKKLVRVYRMLAEMANTSAMNLVEFEIQEDENKAFALFEMRSRIMEKDIERGLERRGGTIVVDDIVTTPYHRESHRVRDAVIVSKAWRDGASPSDVMNTAILTRREQKAFFIKRYTSTYGSSRSNYYWEARRWVDDTDFAMYRCPSLGGRHMRGIEIFTIGDCQSMLLKLTNDKCLELRAELKEATRKQIEAEEMMKDEVDGDDGLTDAEMMYLASMEEVKTISKELVTAEKAFTLVRDRVEKLINRYESLLSKIENGSMAGASSVVTYESSYYSGSEYQDEETRERQIWARRAKRAEIKAEIAAREALMAKAKALSIQHEKEQEIESLQQKLLELQSESTNVFSEREHSVALARSFAMHRNDDARASRNDDVRASSPVPKEPVAVKMNQERIDSVKQRFRDRMAAKKREQYQPANKANVTPQTHNRSGLPPRAVTPSPKQRADMEFFRSAGEEMYQHLDFYERSLKAVNTTRSDT